MNFDRTLSTITTAALVGLVVLNWQGSTKVIQSIAGAVVDYVSSIQGRGFPGGVPVRQGAYPS
jgi:hypothetical protein